MTTFLLKAAQTLGIRTHRTFRLTLRALTLILGAYVGFWVSIFMERNEFSAAWKLFPVLLFLAFIEFVLADVLADRSFPFDTERRFALMEQRLGASNSRN